jgi:hypothetical protein
MGAQSNSAISRRLLATVMGLAVLGAMTGCGSGKDDGPGSDRSGTRGKQTGSEIGESGNAKPRQRHRMPDFAVYLPEDSLFALVARPRQALESLSAQDADFASRRDALEEWLGVNPSGIERIVIASKKLLWRSLADFEGVVIARFKTQFDVTSYFEDRGITATIQHHHGKEYWRVPVYRNDVSTVVQVPFGIYAIDESQFLLAPETTLHAALERTEAKGALCRLLAEADLNKDLVLIASLEGQEELIKRIRSEIDPNELPPQSRGIARRLDEILHVTVSLAFSGERLLRASIGTRDENGARAIHALVEQEISLLKQAYALRRATTVRERGVDEIVKAHDRLIAGLKVEREGAVVHFDIAAPGGRMEFMTAVTMLYEILEARSQARSARDRNTMRALCFALSNYHEIHGAFVPVRNPNSRKAEGMLQASWRVQLLPLMDAATLQSRLKLDEPASSDRNRRILADAAHPYVSAGEGQSTKTRFRTFSGKQTIQPATGQVGMADITDGLANTILLIQVGPEKAVEWYEPRTGISLDSKDLIGELGKPGPNGWLVLFGDCSPGYLPADIDAATLKALVTINGNENVDAARYKVMQKK